MALKGRVELLYASPLFNRADDVTRWETAYQTNLAAVKKLEEGNFGLAYENNSGKNAAGWGKIFSDYIGSEGGGGTVSEAVLVTLYNNVSPAEHLQLEKWNGWEHSLRPANAGGGGGMTPTAEMVDLFPMADGKKPNDMNLMIIIKELFFLNRDQDFIALLRSLGVEWKFDSDDLKSFW